MRAEIDILYKMCVKFWKTIVVEIINRYASNLQNINCPQSKSPKDMKQTTTFLEMYCLFRNLNQIKINKLHTVLHCVSYCIYTIILNFSL